MIKIEHTDVVGFEAAIRGMRNPMNSWADSDSDFKCDDCAGCVWENDCETEFRKTEEAFEEINWCSHSKIKLGENDLRLMQNLIKPGTGDHRKYLRYIDVYVDFEAPLYWWKEFDTYRNGVNAPDAIDIEMNSCSTMHKIHAKKFEIDDFSCENCSENAMNELKNAIKCLNLARENYLETKEKIYWWDMIQTLPTSYNQRRTIKMNYEVLRNMYFARRYHKLDEWREVCKWIESLPYAKELICYEGK